MGNEQSLPTLPENRKSIKISERSMASFPYRIDPHHGVKTIDAQKNDLTIVPIHLENLEYYDLSDNRISEALFEYPDAKIILPLLNTLKLSNNAIIHFRGIVEQLPSLKSLSLDRNFLNIIDLSLSELEHVDLFLNCLIECPKLPQSIISLNCGFNKITTLDLLLPNLKELKISGNLITTINEGVVFPNAKLIDLSHNHLYELPPINQFAPNVELLQLTFNFLCAFPTGLPESIVKLDVSYNCIEKWEDPINHLSNLATLDISNNLLTVLPELPPNIKSLFTENNRFQSIYPISNKKFKQITFLNSQLEEIPDISKTRIKTLVLTRNKLSVLNNPERLNKAVNTVDLAINQITFFNADFFRLTSIQTLILTNNNIHELPDNISHLKLVCLMIGENPISELPALPDTLSVFCGCSCRFSEIPDSLLRLPSLSHLDLSCNLIKCVPSMPKVTFMNLSCNKITDFVEMPPNIITCLLSHNEMTMFSLKNDICTMVVLDISFNKISSLYLHPQSGLKSLKLAFNPLKYEINFASFPQLSGLDITNTKVSYKNSQQNRIHEIATDNPNYIQSKGETSVKLFQCTNDCGYSEFIGVRPTMEDALIIRDIPSQKHNRLFGVLDGHGGSKTATISAFYIPYQFSRIHDKSLNGIQEILCHLNDKLRKLDVKDGATMALALVSRSEILCAHLGDARVVVVQNDGNVIELTYDHKATDRMEFDLLKEKRSFLAFGRVNGTLAVSRSIGDLEIDGIIRSPATTTYNIKNDDKYLVLACDGVFDVMTSLEMGKIVAQINDTSRAAASIVNISFARGSQDNISVLVVDITKIAAPKKKSFSFF